MGGRTQDLHSQGHLLQHAALSAWLTACAAFGMRTVAPQLAEYKPWTSAGKVKKDLKILDRLQLPGRKKKVDYQQYI